MFVFALSCSSLCAARYRGVVVRASDSVPLAGIRVAAALKPPLFTFFPTSDTIVARKITDRHGAFYFDLDQPRFRLYFTAQGRVTRTRVSASMTEVRGGGAMLDRPRADRVSVLRIPDADIPSNVVPRKRPNQAMQRTAGRSAV